MALGKRVKEAREKKGLTQAQLGDLVGLPQSTINGLESRDSSTSYKSTELAEALAVSLRWLLSGEEETSPLSVQTMLTSYQIDSVQRYIPISEIITMVKDDGLNIELKIIEASHKVVLPVSSNNAKAVQVNSSELQPALKHGQVLIYDELAPPIQGEYILVEYVDGTFAIVEYLFKFDDRIEVDRLNQKGRLVIELNKIKSIFAVLAVVMASQKQILA